MSISDSDNRFLLKAPAKAQEIILQKGVPANLANITFIPEASCPRDCYLGIFIHIKYKQKDSGMPLSTSDGQWFAYGMKLPQNLAEIDNYLYSRLRRKWMGLKGKMLQTSVNLDLDRIRGIEIPIKAELVRKWAFFITSRILDSDMAAFIQPLCCPFSTNCRRQLQHCEFDSHKPIHGILCNNFLNSNLVSHYYSTIAIGYLPGCRCSLGIVSR